MKNCQTKSNKYEFVCMYKNGIFYIKIHKLLEIILKMKIKIKMNFLKLWAIHNNKQFLSNDVTDFFSLKLKKFGMLQVNITSDTDIFLLPSRYQLQII